MNNLLWSSFVVIAIWMMRDVLNPPFALWDSNNTEISNGEVVFEGRGTTTKLFGRERQRTLCTKHSSCSTLVVRNDSIMVYRCILYMLFVAHTHTWLGILPRLHDNDNSNWNHDDERNNKNVLKNKVTSTLLALAYVIHHCWSSLGTFGYYLKLVFLLITSLFLLVLDDAKWLRVVVTMCRIGDLRLLSKHGRLPPWSWYWLSSSLERFILWHGT